MTHINMCGGKWTRNINKLDNFYSEMIKKRKYYKNVDKMLTSP